MNHRRAIAGLVVAFGLGASQVARAQCPSNASSCAVCHDGGEGPARSADHPWHVDHAFADLCVGCHGGDRESMDAAAAHLGLVDPLGPAAASCMSCHPTGSPAASGYVAVRDALAAPPTSAAPATPPVAQPRQVGSADGALLAVAVVLAAALALLAGGLAPTPARVWRAIRSPSWPPALAGAMLGVVVAVSEVVCGRPIAVSGGVDRLAAFAGAALFPESSYFRFVVPPAVTWQVWLLVGLVAGAAASSILSGTFRGRWLPDAGWVEVHGRTRRARLVLAFAGAVLVQFGAGVAGGCTSGLAISGGALLAPAAFLFVAGMFAGGIPTAWLWARRAR